MRTPPRSTPIAAAAGGDEAEDAHRLRPLGRLGEQRHDQRQRDRGDDRAAESLHRARADQHRLRRRQPAGERGEREQRDPDQEQPPLAEEVAEPAAEEEKAAEGEQVGVHHPGQRRLGEAEILADRRAARRSRSSCRGRSSGRRGRAPSGRASGCDSRESSESPIRFPYQTSKDRNSSVSPLRVGCHWYLGLAASVLLKRPGGIG